jgi:hypothetical protein
MFSGNLASGLYRPPPKIAQAVNTIPAIGAFIHELSEIIEKHIPGITAKQINNQEEFYTQPGSMTFSTGVESLGRDAGYGVFLDKLLTLDAFKNTDVQLGKGGIPITTTKPRFFLIDICRSVVSRNPVTDPIKGCIRSLSTGARRCTDCEKPQIFANATSLAPYASNPILQDVLSGKGVRASDFLREFQKIQSAPASAPAPIPNGTRVTFVGMVKKPEFNGTMGTIESFELRPPDKRVYTKRRSSPF